MKGLLIKDFFCLKKQYKFFCITIFTVFVISTMFVLSSRYGNINDGFNNMISSGQNTEKDIIAFSQMAMLLCFLIPMALTGNVMDLFVDDRNAGFYKIASAFPITIRKRVASRFISGLAFTVIGCIADIVMALCISKLSDIIIFENYLKIILCFAAIMIIYLSLLILYAYILGTERMVVVSVLPILTGTLILFAINNKKVIDFISNGNFDISIINKLKEFLMNNSFEMLMIAILLLILTYFSCVFIANKKRGVA